MFERTSGKKVVITAPRMDVKTGEGSVMFRYHLPGKSSVSISSQEQGNEFDGSAHLHHGVLEIYTMHEGVLLLAVETPGGIIDVKRLTVTGLCTYVVEPGVPHMAYKYKGAVFTVQKIGVPVPNENRRGNDWYAVDVTWMNDAIEVIQRHIVSDT